MKDEYKEYRRKWNKYPKKEIVSKFPLGLMIELTNRCNLSCPICPYHSKDAPFPVGESTDMNFELYKKIINQGSHNELKTVKLSFSGEPLLYPYLIDAIQYAKNHGILEVAINTNGTLLTSEMSLKLIKAGLDLLILTDYELYDQYNYLVSFKAIRDIRGLKKPKIIIKTFREDIWKAIGDEIVEPINSDYHNLEVDLRKSSFKCSEPWQRILVMADGTVCRCPCGSIMVDKIMGNVNFQSIEELWHSEYMNYLRFCHSNKVTELIPSCASCPARIDYMNKSFWNTLTAKKMKDMYEEHGK